MSAQIKYPPAACSHTGHSRSSAGSSAKSCNDTGRPGVANVLCCNDIVQNRSRHWTSSRRESRSESSNVLPRAERPGIPHVFCCCSALRYSEVGWQQRPAHEHVRVQHQNKVLTHMRMPQILHKSATQYILYSHCTHACSTTNQQGLYIDWRPIALPSSAEGQVGVAPSWLREHHWATVQLTLVRAQGLLKSGYTTWSSSMTPCVVHVCGRLLAWEACCYPD